MRKSIPFSEGGNNSVSIDYYNVKAISKYCLHIDVKIEELYLAAFLQPDHALEAVPPGVPGLGVQTVAELSAASVLHKLLLDLIAPPAQPGARFSK